MLRQASQNFIEPNPLRVIHQRPQGKRLATGATPILNKYGVALVFLLNVLLKEEGMKGRNAYMKYWLRIHHIPIDVFGKGLSKNNPIKVKSRRKK